MNLFNKAIYKNHLEHTAEGTKWGKHKYLYITPSGRYVYPEDVAKGKTQQQFRSRQINDQIKSAHTGSTMPTRNLAGTSGTTIMPNGKKSYWKTDSNGINKDMSVYAYENKRNNTSSVKKQEASKTSGAAAGSKPVATNPATRNTITIKKTETASSKPATTATAKTEEKKTTTANTGEKYKNMSEETKQWLMKNAGKDEKKERETKKGSGKKGGSGKKKGSGSSSKKSASNKTQEANQMGLSDDDLKKMEVNTDATNRDEVLKNIALRVIRGDYGNGTDRKTKLGNYYDEVQKRVNELMKSGNIQREGQSQQQTQQGQTEKKDTTSSSSSNSSSKKEYKQEQYKKGDTDFDESKYTEETRLGNTDFHAYQRKDGKYVILEEDMKWVVDEKPSAKMIKNLEAMDEYIDARKKNGNWNGAAASKEWDQLASIAINGGDLTKKAEAEKAKVKNKKTVKHYDLEEGLFLKHWGVKRRSGRFKFGSGDRPYQHETGHTRRNSTFGERRSMSDEDLETAINRARKEGELHRLERDNRSQGQKFTEDVLTSIGKTVLTKAATGALLWAGKKFASEVLNDEELGTFIANGGPEKKKK